MKELSVPSSCHRPVQLVVELDEGLFLAMNCERNGISRYLLIVFPAYFHVVHCNSMYLPFFLCFF